MASRLGWLFMVVAMWLFVYRLILREEDSLRRNQGESYRAYLNPVPRLWPAFAPRVPNAGVQPRWGQSIASEMFIWLFGAAVLSFAITLNFKMTCIGFASSLVVYFVAVYLVKKRAGTTNV